MNCIKCGTETYPSATTEAIELGNGGLLVLRNIPCRKCKKCDEVLYSGTVVEQIEKITKYARHLLQEITVIDFTKVA